MDATDVARGAAWGLVAGVGYALALGCYVAAVEPDGRLVAGAVVLGYAGLVAGVAGLLLGTLVAVCALALPRVPPQVAGPLWAAALWSLPWVVTGTFDPRDDVEAACLFYAGPLVCGVLAALRWGSGVGRSP